MTPLESLFRETVRAVDGVCWQHPHLGPDDDCDWLGHATIRERLEKIAERQHVSPDYCGTEGYISAGCAALRVRLKEAINDVRKV